MAAAARRGPPWLALAEPRFRGPGWPRNRKDQRPPERPRPQGGGESEPFPGAIGRCCDGRAPELRWGSIRASTGFEWGGCEPNPVGLQAGRTVGGHFCGVKAVVCAFLSLMKSRQFPVANLPIPPSPEVDAQASGAAQARGPRIIPPSASPAPCRVRTFLPWKVPYVSRRFDRRCYALDH
jgi:hypothetical protein